MQSRALSGDGHMTPYAEARRLLPQSNCLRRQYACVIVKDGRTISVGWNESPTPCTACAREGLHHNSGDYAECHSVHAEMMALLEASLDELEGAKLYLVCNQDPDPEPCPICRRLMDFCGVELARDG